MDGAQRLGHEGGRLGEAIPCPRIESATTMFSAFSPTCNVAGVVCSGEQAVHERLMHVETGRDDRDIASICGRNRQSTSAKPRGRDLGATL